MNFGILSLANHNPQHDGSDAEILRDQVAQAVLAEELGLDSFWVAEHHATHYGGIVPANAVLAAAIATTTKRIRIGAGGAILTLHHPLEIAEQWAMVDCLSRGRLELAMSRAFLPYEFALFDISMDESRSRFEEASAFIRQAWSGEALGFTGKHYRVPNLGTLTPRPVQRPRPPMWVTTAMSPESFVWAGRQGYGILVVPYVLGLENLNPLLNMYISAYEAAGFERAACRIQATYHLFLGEDNEQARREAEPLMNYYLQSFGEGVQRAQVQSPDYAHYAKLGEVALTFDMLYESGRIIVGTPERAIAQIREILASSPITDFTFVVDFGAMPRSLVRRTIQRLAREVVPSLRVTGGSTSC